MINTKVNNTKIYYNTSNKWSNKINCDPIRNQYYKKKSNQYKL